MVAVTNDRRATADRRTDRHDQRIGHSTLHLHVVLVSIEIILLFFAEEDSLLHLSTVY